MDPELTSPATGPRPRFAWGLLFACAVYILFRVVTLLFIFDEVSIPIFELPGVGMIPWLVVDGWKGASPPFFYDNCGGLISTGFLAIPFYALFGPSYLVLKLVPATLGFVTLLLIWRYVNRFVSRPAANWAALMFAVVPPTLTRFSVIAQGNHFENLVFQTTVLTVFAAVQSRPDKTWRIFFLGLASGFAIFTYFGSLAIVALTAGLHLCVRGPRRALRELLLYIPGFALGIAPLIWVAFAEGRPQNAITSLLVGEGGGSDRLERFRHFALDKLPSAGTFKDLGPVPREVGEGLFLAAFLAAWLVLMPGVLASVVRCIRSWQFGKPADVPAEHDAIRARFRTIAKAPFVLYFPTIAFVITFGSLRFSTYTGLVEVGSNRYFVPHFMYASMVVCTAAVSLWKVGGLRRLFGAAIGAAMVLTVPFGLPLPSANAVASSGAHYNGYWMPYYSGVALRGHHFDRETRRYEFDLDRVHSAFDDFPPHDRQEILFGVGFHLSMALDLSPGYEGAPRALDVAEGFDEEDIPVLARGLGAYLAQTLQAKAARGRRALANLEQTVEDEGPYIEYVLEGLSLSSGFPLTSTLSRRFQRARTIGKHIPAPMRAEWMVGRGMAYGRIASRAQPSDVDLLDDELKSLRDGGSRSFWEGVGRGLATQLSPLKARTRLGECVPKGHRRAAMIGLGAELRRYYPDLDVETEPWQVGSFVDGDEHAAFRRGWDG